MLLWGQPNGGESCIVLESRLTCCCVANLLKRSLLVVHEFHVNLLVAVWAYAESSYVTTDDASYCNASRLSINTSVTLNFHSRFWQSCHSSRKSLKSSQFLFLEHNTGFSLANGTVPFRNSNMPFGSVPKPTMCPLGPPQNQHIFNNHLNY